MLVKNHQAVVSPYWNIYAGSGANHYGFSWGTARENNECGDRDSYSLLEMQ